jgi:hypothetical protein
MKDINIILQISGNYIMIYAESNSPALIKGDAALAERDFECSIIEELELYRNLRLLYVAPDQACPPVGNGSKLRAWLIYCK